MKKNYLLLPLIFILFYSNLSFSQNINDIATNYENYFQNTREIPYLHINKTSFLEGEEIWFQAYVLEQNSQKLHPTTSNLYVSIFDNNGKLKDQQLVHIKNGKGRGNIQLDSSYTQENYYLKASTKWMKNFNESNAYIQKIKLISNMKEIKRPNILEEDFYDFQIFPEGGHFVEDLANTTAILIKDKNGKGLQINSGILKELSSNKIIEKFSTNNFGQSKFAFYYEKGKEYSVEISLTSGSTIS
jgi:hypothetical protein